MKNKRLYPPPRTPRQQKIQDALTFELQASALYKKSDIYTQDPDDAHFEEDIYQGNTRYRRVPPWKFELHSESSALLKIPPQDLIEHLTQNPPKYWIFSGFYYQFIQTHLHDTLSLELFHLAATQLCPEDLEDLEYSCLGALKRLRPKHEDALPYFRDLLHLVAHPVAIRNILLSIGTMGTLASPFIPTILSLVHSRDDQVQAQAAHTLSLLGPRDPKVLQSLKYISQQPSPIAQKSAFLALLRMGEMPRKILADLTPPSPDSEPNRLKAWIRLIGKFQYNPETNIRYLSTILTLHKDATVQEAAVIALGKYSSEAVNSQIIERLLLLAKKTEHARLREASLRSLGKLCTPSHLPNIYTFLQKQMANFPYPLLLSPPLLLKPEQREEMALAFEKIAHILPILLCVQKRVGSSKQLPPLPNNVLALCLQIQQTLSLEPALWKGIFATYTSSCYTKIYQAFQSFLTTPNAHCLALHRHDFEETLFQSP